MIISKVHDEYFAKEYNLISNFDRNNLIQDCDYFLKNNCNRQEIHPPLMCGDFFDRSLLKRQQWKNLFKIVFNKVSEYSDNYLNKKIKFKTCWINKHEHYTEEEIRERLYYHEDLKCFSDNHYHKHEDDVISCVYYLKNNNKNHGTIIRCDSENLILDGEENSITIFNSQLYHAALFGPPDFTEIYPRYAIILSFR